MTIEPVILFLLPLVVSISLWLTGPHYRTARLVSLVTVAAMLAVSIRVVIMADSPERWVHFVGEWPAPFGITWVVDRLSALFAFIQSVLLVGAVGMLRSDTHGETVCQRSYPALFALSAGLMGASFTGDIFNLFVMFEIVLIVSYLLIQVPGTDRSLRAGFPNVVINVIAAAFFFMGVGILYAACGSVNMADLAVRAKDADPALVLAGASMVVAAFAMKAGVIPLVVFWLPGTYPTFSGPVAAFFGGMLTKLGVYALIRTSQILLTPTGLDTVLLWLGAVTSLIGVLMAFAQYELRRLLSFHIVSQVGYMVAAIGLNTVAGIAAAIFFALHNILVKSTLYFTADELERSSGTRDLRRMHWYRGGAATALVFSIAAFSIAGVPPLSGFFGKLAVFQATYSSQAMVPLALLVIASFFTLGSMVKIWGLAFQVTPDAKAPENFRDERPASRLAPVGVIAAVSVTMGLGAGWMGRYSRAAAEQVMDVDGAASAVLLPGASERPRPKALIIEQEHH